MACGAARGEHTAVPTGEPCSRLRLESTTSSRRLLTACMRRVRLHRLAQEQERHEQERQEKKSKKRRCLGCLQLLNKLEAPSAEAALLPSAEGQAFKPAGFSAKDIRTAASFLAALGETVELSMKAELVRRVAEKQAQQQKSKQRFRAAGKAAAFAVAGGKRSSKQGRHRSS